MQRVRDVFSQHSAGAHVAVRTQLPEANPAGSPGAGSHPVGRSAVIPYRMLRALGAPARFPTKTSLVMPPRFHWMTFDLTDWLPWGWRQQIVAAADAADFREFPRTPILSRESGEVSHILRGRVHAADVRRELPWLRRMYQGQFLELAQAVCDEPVTVAADDRYGVVLNVQHGNTMRFECHIDSNPLTGLLFCTDHPADEGGELVFAHDLAASDIDAVERACSVIRPHAGHLIFFDGRYYPHYARPLRSKSQVRIVAVMNYYTGSCPESTRPLELNHHLFGWALTARGPALMAGTRDPPWR